MSKLVIRALRCVEETDELGSDDVYMALFRGSFTLPPTVNVVGGKDTKWAEMDSGDLVIADMVLDDNYHPENTYVAALIEQDAKLDLKNDRLAKATEYWISHWTQFPKFPEVPAITALALAGGIRNDDILGARTLAPMFTTGGIGQLLQYEEDGGYYRARAVLRA